jgi:autotransporter-associated beta strand protein
MNNLSGSLWNLVKSRRACAPAGLLLALLLGMTATASAVTSELWGGQGELWCPSSRLPDFSFAGYHSGEAAIPTPAVVANVTDFGAVGDGVTDDSDAFDAAINAVSSGAILVPAGRYNLTRVLYIRKSNVVLRGAGPGSTTLVFTNSLTDLLGPPPGTAGLESWSWGGGLIWVEGVETTTKLADVTADAQRGDSVLTVSGTAGLSVGMTIRLTMTDPDGSLGRHIHADQLDAHPTLVGRRLVRFPSKIAAINGNEITLERPLRLDVRTVWQPEIRDASGQLDEVGIENFTIEFPDLPYPGHFFTEEGYNGIWMDGAWNSWVRNITVTNSDNGIMIERSIFCTVEDVALTASVSRRYLTGGTYYAGHHGIQLRRSDDCLIRDFSVPTRFVHDLTVEDATGCVFMKGSGVDLNFDHHTYLPYENLFTEINAGAGTRHWSSSGSRVPASGARETFWNITSTNPVTALPNDPTRGHWPQQNVIGMTTTLATSKDPVNAWIEAIAPASLVPANLYEAQLARRLAPPTVIPLALQWDGAGVGTPGAQGGAGTWNVNASTNWWNGSINVAWPAPGGEDDNATFGGTAGTVTNDSAGVVVNDLSINTAGYNFTGGPIVLNGTDPTFTMGGGMSQSEAVIAGSCGLTKTGSATLQLRAANRYQGDTRVRQGILLIGAANNRLPISTRLILGEGTNSGTFQMNSRSQEVGGLLTSGSSTNNRVINSNPTTTTFTVNLTNAATTHLFNGTLGGTGANDNNYHFVKAGFGALVLAGDCTYTGGTTISAGTLQIGNDGATGSLSPANVTNNGTLRFDRTGTVTVSNLISGAGGLRVDCPYTLGTVALRASNTFTGSVQVTSGTLSITNGAALGSGDKSVSLTTGYGTLRLEGANVVVPATVTFSTSGEPAPGRIYNSSGDNLIAGPINLSLGAGTTLIASDGGTLNLAGLITAPTANRTLKLGGSSTGNNQVSGSILQTNGWDITVEKLGGGTWALSGSNGHSGATILGTNLTGSPYVSDGVLRLAHSAALGSGTLVVNGGYQAGSVELTGDITVANPVSFYGRQGVTYSAIRNASGTNALIGDINVVANGSSLNFESQAGLLTISGSPMTGASGRTLTFLGTGEGVFARDITSAVVTDVRQFGTGTWTLSGSNDFTGTTTANGGRFIAAHTSAFGVTGRPMSFGGNATSTFELATDSSLKAYQLWSSSGTTTVGNLIANRATPGASITHNLGGMALGTSKINFTKGAHVSDTATLTFTSLGLSAGGASTVTLNPTTARVSISGGVSGAGTAAAKTLALEGDASVSGHTLAGSISDGTATPLSLVKNGSSEWTLSGNSSFTGPTAVSNGVLRVTGALTNSAVTVVGGKLTGTGTCGGAVAVTGGTIEPGVSTNLSETLTIRNDLALAGTALLQIGKSGTTPINDQIVGVTNITYGGTLIVTNATGATLADGDAFVLFSASGTKTGNFTNIVVAPAAPGLIASFNPTNGTLSLVSAVVPPPSTPTNLTFSVTSSNITLSWPTNYQGWYLQMQTNLLNKGLSTNWSTIAGSESVTSTNLPITKTDPAVFFRMVYTNAP